MVKSHKIYTEEEKQASESRMKANLVEEKIRRRSTNLFNSMAQLHKTHVKLNSRKEDCESRSTSARNEYLFQLAAINAHLGHYLKKDVPDLATILDGDLFEKFRQTLSTSCRAELDLCKVRADSLNGLLTESEKINRIHAWNQFIKESPALSEGVQFQFEPMEGDMISVLLAPNPKENNFDQIAKKLARQFVSRERRIKVYKEEVEEINSGRISPLNKVPNQVDSVCNLQYSIKNLDGNLENVAFNSEFAEQKIDELQFAILREEIEKEKVEACLDLLKRSSESYLAVEAYAESTASEVKRQISNLDSNHTPKEENTTKNDGTNDLKSGKICLRDETPSIKLSPEHKDDPECVPSVRANIPTATALYEFLATRYDELDLVENEKVELLGFGDGEHWIKVRSLIDGKEGLVPLNFLSLHPSTAIGASEGLPANKQFTFSTVDTAVTTLQTSSTVNISPSITGTYSKESIINVNGCTNSLHSSEDIPNVTIKCDQKSDEDSKSNGLEPHTGQLVRALTDFVGTESDELTFQKGYIIRILGRSSATADVVDDGWLAGELISPLLPDSSIPRGLFPSMLVQVISDYQAPLQQQTVAPSKESLPIPDESHMVPEVLTSSGKSPSLSKKNPHSGDHGSWHTLKPSLHHHHHHHHHHRHNPSHRNSSHTSRDASTNNKSRISSSTHPLRKDLSKRENQPNSSNSLRAREFASATCSNTAQKPSHPLSEKLQPSSVSQPLEDSLVNFESDLRIAEI